MTKGFNTDLDSEKSEVVRFVGSKANYEENAMRRFARLGIWQCKLSYPIVSIISMSIIFKTKIDNEDKGWYNRKHGF